MNNLMIIGFIMVVWALISYRHSKRGKSFRKTFLFGSLVLSALSWVFINTSIFLEQIILSHVQLIGIFSDPFVIPISAIIVMAAGLITALWMWFSEKQPKRTNGKRPADLNLFNR